MTLDEHIQARRRALARDFGLRLTSGCGLVTILALVPSVERPTWELLTWGAVAVFLSLVVLAPVRLAHAEEDDTDWWEPSEFEETQPEAGQAALRFEDERPRDDTSPSEVDPYTQTR